MYCWQTSKHGAFLRAPNSSCFFKHSFYGTAKARSNKHLSAVRLASDPMLLRKGSSFFIASTVFLVLLRQLFNIHIAIFLRQRRGKLLHLVLFLQTSSNARHQKQHDRHAATKLPNTMRTLCQPGASISSDIICVAVSLYVFANISVSSISKSK